MRITKIPLLFCFFLSGCAPSTSYLSEQEIAFSQIESDAERQRMLEQMYSEYFYEAPQESKTFNNPQAQELYDALREQLGTDVRGIDIGNRGRYRFAASAYALSKEEAESIISQTIENYSISNAEYLQIVVYTFEGYAFTGFANTEQAENIYKTLGFEPKLSYDEWLRTLPASIRDPNYDFEARRKRELARQQRKARGASCCRVCTVGKPCGGSCINKNETCYEGAGCACAGDLGKMFYASLTKNVFTANCDVQ